MSQENLAGVALAAGSGRLGTGWVTALVVVVGLGTLLPFVPAAAALAAGILLAITVGNPLAARTRVLSRQLLPAAVVGLGGAMDLQAVLRVGARGVGYTVVGIAVTFALGWLLSRALAVRRVTGLLITVGTAICGGSAIAAAAPVLAADEDEISVSLGTVFLLNAAALLVFPAVGHALSLGQKDFGMWAALAIHDTSSVVGASMQYGPASLEIATTVKLARALWIVPVTLLMGVAFRDPAASGPRRAGRRPWFILGFLAVAAAASLFPALRGPGLFASAIARRALVLTLFLIGLGLSRETLRSVGVRPLILGVLLWVAAGIGTLLAILGGLISVS
jgi:uncharacterized integral membrane protein (TIGR00698 family)